MSSSSAGVHKLPASPDLWKRVEVPVIGLTGAIGAGKSQVAALLGAKGAVVIDADRVGHEVLELPEVRSQVIKQFGARIADPAGMIDRRTLGAIVFNSPAALSELEAIVHPPMRRRFQEILEREQRRGLAPVLVLDAAILLEAGWDDLCDLVVFVAASPAVRLQRVASARGWSAEVLQSREAVQWPQERKLERADVVIDNDGELERLGPSIDQLLQLVTDRKRQALHFSESVPSDPLDGSAEGFSGTMKLEPGAPFLT